MKKRILIVDDSRYMRSNINEAMIRAGFEVVGQAATGETAIDMAYDLEPEFITLDNILPDMLGLDVLRTLKGDENFMAKVIMVSAVGQESSIQEGLSLGASDYLVKPSSADEIVDAINKASLENAV